MLIEHRGRRPVVPDSAHVAPSATLCGAVVLGEGVQIGVEAVERRRRDIDDAPAPPPARASSPRR